MVAEVLTQVGHGDVDLAVPGGNDHSHVDEALAVHAQILRDAVITSLLRFAGKCVGAYNGTVTLSGGPSVITVRADGGWGLGVG